MNLNNLENWDCDQLATLMFCIDQDKVLLIHKKRGLGAGKINGPGGKLEQGESLVACAYRETFEETGITALNASDHGILCFRFLDGLRLRVHIFVTHHFSGEIVETDEASPFWHSISEIPYQDMWADDVHWLPHVLAGGRAYGYFDFDGDRLLEHSLSLL